MSKVKQTLTEAFLERISRGAVPVGGFYWVDPKELRGRAGTQGAVTERDVAGRDVAGRDVAGRDVVGRDLAAPKSAAHGMYAAPAGERS